MNEWAEGVAGIGEGVSEGPGCTQYVWTVSSPPLATPYPLPLMTMQVITSMNLVSEPGSVVLLASTTLPQARGPAFQQLSLAIPRIDAYFTGTGANTVWLPPWVSAV